MIGIGKDHVAESQIDIVLMAGTACFVLPYLVLAAPAGYLADRYPKRSVIVGCKVAEIVIMVLGVAAILCGNLETDLGAGPDVRRPSPCSARKPPCSRRPARAAFPNC